MEKKFNRREQDHWTVDKRIPLALLIALLINIGSWVWWASDLSSRMNNVERQAETQENLKERVIALEIVLSRLDTTVTKLDETLDDLRTIIIENKRSNN